MRKAGRYPQLLALSPLSSTPTHFPNVGLLRRMSTATSNTVPRSRAPAFPAMLRQLVVQSAQHAARRSRMVVLHEVHFVTDGLVESATVEALQEEAALVAEHLRLEDQARPEVAVA